MDDNQTNLSAPEGGIAERAMNDTDARLAARLKHILETPGISDKDRKLVDRNLKRLLAAAHAE